MNPTTRTPEKIRVFLEALGATCNVTDAAGIANIPRTTLYEWRRSDPEFAKAWDEAKEVGADSLEDEAVRRARDGVDEPVIYKGIDTGLRVRKYSDTLLIFLLNGAKPEKYKHRVSNELSGPGGSPIQVDDKEAADRIASLLNRARERHSRADDLA